MQQNDSFIQKNLAILKKNAYLCTSNKNVREWQNLEEMIPVRAGVARSINTVV